MRKLSHGVSIARVSLMMHRSSHALNAIDNQIYGNVISLVNQTSQKSWLAAKAVNKNIAIESFKTETDKMNGGKKSGLWSRRDFFTRVAWSGVGIFSLISSAGFLRAAFPRVLFLPPSTFKAGVAADYAFNTVSEKYKQDERVWIIREEQGIYVLFAKCTHLGCTPRWLAAEDKFKCPCHGSGFYKSGMNFEGPAPRPLDRFGVSLNENGQLIVDKSKIFKMQPGTEPEEQYPESVLKV
jgi:cytochrome b6-f complex iron-sulfur subunit